MSTTRHPARTAGRLAALVGAAALVVAAAVAPAQADTTAPAPAPAPQAGQGWLRVAHLSPDTKDVDVTVTAVSGGASVVELDGVGYGAVSDYSSMPAGTYVIAMRPTGETGSGAPAISATVDVTDGASTTVAAYGPADDLETAVFSDDLTAPAEGEGRVRLVQASLATDSVDVATTEGLVIAEGAETGTATGYATVPAGTWGLELTGVGGATGSSVVDVASGSVSTLLVLDNASGGLTISPVLDSAAAAAVPVGGVDTGGGYLASGHKLAGALR